MADDSQADSMEGVELNNKNNANLPLFTEQEQRILDLYDRMEELQLEIAVLKSGGVLSPDNADEASEADIRAAKQDLLQAKSAYQLRNTVFENALIANPILKAVHAGDNATVAEQDLLPLLEKRDTLSTSLTVLTSKVLLTRNELIKIEAEHIAKASENVELTSKMISLASDANAEKRDDIDWKSRKRLDELDVELKTSRQKWRIMKGTTSGTIVGSGIDWARNPKLLELVLNNDAIDG